MDINKKAAQAASAGTAKSEQTNPNTKPEGRYVKVYTSIWLDRRFRELSPDGKLAFLHLLTCPGMTALGAMKASARRLWGARVIEAMAEQIDAAAPLIVLAGRNYRDPLWPQIERRASVPMEGLGIGQQLAWLSDN